MVQVPALKPERRVKAVLQWLRGQSGNASVALVGHEPQLGVLISWLLSGRQQSFVKLKKGSACLLEFAGEIESGGATLLWMLKPSQLRKLGR
jgi:phosphohistidine phosphatase